MGRRRAFGGKRTHAFRSARLRDGISNARRRLRHLLHDVSGLRTERGSRSQVRRSVGRHRMASDAYRHLGPGHALAVPPGYPSRGVTLMLDTALRRREAEGRPIRVGMIGAGATGRAIALQLGTPVPGIRLAAVANRTPAHAERALRDAGISDWRHATSVDEAQSAIRSGKVVLTDDPFVVTGCPLIDIVVEVTGTIRHAAQVVLSAFAHRKHVVIVNAELDSLIGPILKTKADEAGVVITHTDGDEPGVAMTLLRYLRSLGLSTVAAGNIKGMVDYYRTPDTQRAFAEKNDQDVRKVTSFADATKLSMEATVLSNATGFGVARRGMTGPACGYVRDLAKLLPADAMLNGGI